MGEDALDGITSLFRKTDATNLDDARLPARQIADQLGHVRPSLTERAAKKRGDCRGMQALSTDAA